MHAYERILEIVVGQPHRMDLIKLANEVAGLTSDMRIWKERQPDRKDLCERIRKATEGK